MALKITKIYDVRNTNRNLDYSVDEFVSEMVQEAAYEYSDDALARAHDRIEFLSKTLGKLVDILPIDDDKKIAFLEEMIPYRVTGFKIEKE
ncbi:hypothetical protein [Caulobacter phage Cr30]|uniref:hypothetical protein n=1 Tax=Caulobacter phage Cr30 TaxID=1357714 RepID=UPI0004A9B539|nr:hypothetical protein OZ74_gp168 [Caulobacter phage Cr30]AGS81053.1 hypothetical protein [Caulobacter phage Cr30]